MITNFEEIKSSEKVNGICQKCGKKRTRTVKESMTENPWNKNQDGTVRTRREIHEAVNKLLRKSVKNMQDNFMCGTCFSELPWPQKWPV